MNFERPKGIVIALLILISWGGSLVWLLGQTKPLQYLPAVLWQTFLYTGLFITAHDAMHGSVLPGNARVNRAIGSIAVFLYALFSYRVLRQKHHEHHRYSGSSHDPDFHENPRGGFWMWYLRFMREYLRLPQIVGMAIMFNFLQHIVGIALPNLLIYWVVPSLLSTVQLFYFGTYLPHRNLASGFPDKHCARSTYWPTIISFLTCYHFGAYHHEHHQYPGTPWWRLPGRSKT